MAKTFSWNKPRIREVSRDASMTSQKVVFRMEISRDSHYHTPSIDPGFLRGADNRPNHMTTQTFYRQAAAILVAALTMLSQPVVAAGDPEQGKELGFTCLGCHGIEGQRNAYPSFRVPRLGGQNSEYLETALHAYREGTRPHPTMQAQAGSLSDDDIDNLVAWLGSVEQADDMATAEQGAGVASAQICVTCHGADGANVQPAPPILAGQHEDYLVYALKQYKDGTRSGNVMAAFAATLSDSDMELIAGFYASQDGVETLE
jgi:cytochrome c553